MKYKLRFSRWDLESLMYQSDISSRLDDDYPYYTEQTKKPLVDYLPGVKQFCYVGREVFLQWRGFGRSNYDVFYDQ